jgi:hypothetical protein
VPVQFHDVEQLAAALANARDSAAARTGRVPSGVRLVEPSADAHWYLCAVDDAFLCLDEGLAVETDPRHVHTAAGCVLLVEHAETFLDPAELSVVVPLAERIDAQLGDPALRPSLRAVAGTAEALLVWREAPARAVASLPQLEVGVRLHDAFRAAWGVFVVASDPLVERQDELPAEAVDALRDIEQAGGRCGAVRSLAADLGEAISAVDAGADEIVARHLVPLSSEG